MTTQSPAEHPDASWAAEVQALPDLLTAKEAGTVLRLNVQTVRKLASKGQLPGRRVGGEWRFFKKKLLALLDSPGSDPDPDPDPELA